MLGLGKGHNHGEWYINWRDHPGPLVKSTEIKDYLWTQLQESCNVYEPIKAYAQQWKHETDKSGMMTNAYPVGDPRRADLPPLYTQWKQDWKKRFLKAIIRLERKING
jgi:hypothetical protein|tara:strand:+ start:245 stop:568 length:324 start_codon:yes stop_codon:yes gene_type:complete